MENNKICNPTKLKKPAYTLLAASLAQLLSAPQAYAFSFEYEGISGGLDTTLSYGRIWRVQGQDKSNDSINDNDGNRAFGTGLVSEVFKVTSELEARYENYGLFTRGTAAYDTQIMDKRNDYYSHNTPEQPSQNYPRDNRFTYDTRHTAGRNAELLDAYVYGNWDVAGKPLTVKFGRQVFNWGEGIFYRNGVNTTNPMDATKYNLPGSELKEVLVPLEALNFSLGLTDNLFMEAYYQWNWKETAVNPAGTFYSESDIFGPGGNKAYTTVENPLINQLLAAYPTVAQLGLVGNGPLGPNSYLNPSTNTFSVGNRGSDINARDDGQFGLALRYMAESLNQTEFGFYFVNYHSKEPVISVGLDGYQGVDFTNPMWGFVPPVAQPGLAALDMAANTVMRRKYVEDIRMYGLSFNTNIGVASVFGEISYRPNMPITVAATSDVISDLLNQGFGELTSITDGSVADSAACAAVSGGQICRNQANHNYERVEAYTTSLGTILNFDSQLGFDSLMVVAELSSEHLRGSSLKYTAYDGTVRHYEGTYGPVSDDAYGYTIIVNGTWNNVVGGINVSPFLVFAHDFKGTSHLTGNFFEDTKAMTVGVRGIYLGSLEAELSYTQYFDNNDLWLTRDRDNIGMNVKYSF